MMPTFAAVGANEVAIKTISGAAINDNVGA